LPRSRAPRPGDIASSCATWRRPTAMPASTWPCANRDPWPSTASSAPVARNWPAQWSGAARITAGEVLVHGRPAAIRDPAQALRRYRIGYVSEDRKGEGLILSHPVVTNIAMTIWRRIASALGLVGGKAEAAAVAPYVEQLAIRISSLSQLAGTLSGGNQQKVSIAKWLAAATDILIVDEPTVGIDIKTKVELHELLGALSRQGVAILLISSDMAEMITLADRIIVLHGFAIAGEVANDHRYDTTSTAIMEQIHRVDAASGNGSADGFPS